jgi:hypothetical protein
LPDLSQFAVDLAFSWPVKKAYFAVHPFGCHS